jgi:hypothetical protein
MFCWNHLKGDFKFWLKEKVESDNIKVYVDHVDKMLHCDSEDEFLELKSNLTSKWTPVVFSRLRTTFILSERLLVMPEYGSNIPGYSSITHFPE